MTETIKLADLTPDARNANKGTKRGADMINRSLGELGAGRSILVDKNGKIIAGNKTTEGAAAIGIEDVIVVRTDGNQLVAVMREDLDLDDPTGKARQLAYADNRAGQVGLEWDADVLADDLAAGIDLSDWFQPVELEAFGITEPEPTADAAPQVDRAEELAAEWGVQPGQMWRLASRVEGQEHRIICGDCTDAAVVERLMGGGRATLFATDPPYLVDYDGTNHPQAWNASERVKKVTNKDWSATYKDWDAAEQGVELYDGFVSVAIEHAITSHAAWYCWHASRRQAMLEDVWERHGAFVHQQIIWAKDRPVLTRSFYMWQHEPCFFGWIKGNKPERVVDEYLSTVWQFPTQTAFERTDHPTQKPTQLFEIPMRQHTRPGELCYEPFSGSGAQIVAAENLGRQCRAVEIAAPFVAVALQRYQDAFGIKPELVN